MTKVYPNLNHDITQSEEFNCGKGGGEAEVVLTVWRKSLLFNGHGFTVFDPKGDLLFRVDNYASESRGEIVLMDANGKPLLTIKRKVRSIYNYFDPCLYKIFILLLIFHAFNHSAMINICYINLLILILSFYCICTEVKPKRTLARVHRGVHNRAAPLFCEKEHSTIK